MCRQLFYLGSLVQVPQFGVALKCFHLCLFYCKPKLNFSIFVFVLSGLFIGYCLNVCKSTLTRTFNLKLFVLECLFQNKLNKIVIVC